jgi:hypothetical protein
MDKYAVRNEPQFDQKREASKLIPHMRAGCVSYVADLQQVLFPNLR